MNAIQPLPGYAQPREILRDAAALLDPPNRLSVTEAAEAFVRVPIAGVWAAFDRGVTPYFVEPADITQARRFSGVVVMGPSQSGKSQLLLNTALHSVMCDPSPVQIIHMTRADANSWVEDKLDPAIYNSPSIRARLGQDKEDSTFFRKRFRGMTLEIGHPTPRQLSSKSKRLVLLTDYDHMPAVLGGADNPEGSPFGMAGQRIITYMSRGSVLAESTPAWPVIVRGWRQPEDAPHMMPPTAAGVAALYNEGTRGRWYWRCLDCDEVFEPRFDRLRYDASLSPGEAGAGAEMVCPECGSLIQHRHKAEMNRRALDTAGWLHEGAGGALVPIDDITVRDTSIASYALNGAAAAFLKWPDMVAQYLAAEERARSLGDEIDLRRVTYTLIGLPYEARVSVEEGELTGEGLRVNAVEARRGECPRWTRFVTVSVDVQINRFPVQVTAWGERGERLVIDRFDLVEVPHDAPRAGDRALDPARYPEDWQVLLPLGERVWPVAGASYGLRAMALSVDFQGAPGVSDRAEEFWRGRRADGEAGRWYLTRGHGGFGQSRRIWYEAPERGSKGKKARSIKLLNIATDRLKDSVIASLQRMDDGAGAYHLPAWMEDEHLAEFCAEVRGDKGWTRKENVKRNESLDLSVQSLALVELKGANRINWDAPPIWAVGGPENVFAVVISQPTPPTPDDPAPKAQAQPQPKPQAAPRRIKYFQR